MTWWTYIYPKRLLKTSSKFNQDIRVLEDSGKPKLLVNGSRQSGEYVKNLWRQALRAFDIHPSDGNKEILVFGVAGGDVIHLFGELYPGAHITGVDIDKTMIDIGKTYFGLGTLRNVSFVVGDAQIFMKAKDQKHRYDIVILDIFNGWSVPDFVFEDDFLDHLQQLLATKGQLFINYIGEKEYKKKSDVFYEKLHARFPLVLDTVVYLNRFFLASN